MFKATFRIDEMERMECNRLCGLKNKGMRSVSDGTHLLPLK